MPREAASYRVMVLHIINPVLNWYLAHAWIYRHNPAGVWADFNPEVTCP